VASGWCRDRFQSGGVVAAGPGSAARHKPIPQHSGILLHGSDMAASVATVERIRRAFQAEAEFIDGLPVRATLCAGVAGANTKVSLESLLKDADIALYRAKNSGRNRVQTLMLLAAIDGTITHVA